MSGKMPRAPGLRGLQAREGPNIYYYKIRASFVKEIHSFRSTFRDEIEKSSSIRELTDLLIIKNYFMSSSFPKVCMAFLVKFHGPQAPGGPRPERILTFIITKFVSLLSRKFTVFDPLLDMK